MTFSGSTEVRSSFLASLERNDPETWTVDWSDAVVQLPRWLQEVCQRMNQRWLLKTAEAIPFNFPLSELESIRETCPMIAVELIAAMRNLDSIRLLTALSKETGMVTGNTSPRSGRRLRL